MGTFSLKAKRGHFSLLLTRFPAAVDENCVLGYKREAMVCIKKFFVLLFFAVAVYHLPCVEAEEKAPLGAELVFHDIGRNVLHIFTYNYGLNFAVSGFSTWMFIETGIDWKWRNLAYNNGWLTTQAGLPALYVGYVVPVAAPLAAVALGAFKENEKLKIAGFALAQTLILTLAVQTPLKMISTRETPKLVNALDQKRAFNSEDFSGAFNWFKANPIAGWPSGHTANAFAAAATISEIYKDNLWVNVAAYSYAAFIGIGVSLSVHWASDVIAGALIGYAVGKTVGKSFSEVLRNTPGKKDMVSWYATPASIGIIIRI